MRDGQGRGGNRQCGKRLTGEPCEHTEPDRTPWRKDSCGDAGRDHLSRIGRLGGKGDYPGLLVSRRKHRVTS